MPAYKIALSITIPEDAEINEVVSDIEDSLEELDNVNSYTIASITPETEQ